MAPGGLAGFENAKEGLEAAPSGHLVVVFKTYKRVPLGLGREMWDVLENDAKLNSFDGYTIEKCHLYAFDDRHEKSRGQTIAGIELKECHMHFFMDKVFVSDFEWPSLYAHDSDAEDSEYEAMAYDKRIISHPKYKVNLDELKEIFVEEVIKHLQLRNVIVFTLLEVSPSGPNLQVSVCTLSGELCDMILEGETTVANLKKKISSVRELQMIAIRVVSKEGEVLPDEFRLRIPEGLQANSSSGSMSFFNCLQGMCNCLQGVSVSSEAEITVDTNTELEFSKSKVSKDKGAS